jgi:hypothetical protein
MKGHGAKLGRKKEEAVAALLASNSVEDAARAIGIHVNTLRRWMQLPDFKEEYLQARRDSVHQSTARLQKATSAASVTILRTMTDPSVPAAVRLRAAESVLEYANEGRRTRGCRPANLVNVLEGDPLYLVAASCRKKVGAASRHRLSYKPH